MNVYQTEEEQVEAIKRWWKENGRSVIAGVVIGLGGVLGWQGWVQYKDKVGGQGAMHYQQLTAAADSGSMEVARAHGEQLVTEYDNTPYAVFAALSLARLQVAQGDLEAAAERLRWAMENADDKGLAQIARLRLVRVLLDQLELDRAAALLEEPFDASFAGAVSALKGDLARARGDIEAARQAYTAALENGVGAEDALRMKLDDLAATP